MTDEEKSFEDEAFEEIKRKIDAARRKSYGKQDVLELPQLKAEQFVADNNVHELGNITLSMAYEFGYRAAMYAAERKKDE